MKKLRKQRISSVRELTEDEFDEAVGAFSSSGTITTTETRKQSTSGCWEPPVYDDDHGSDSDVGLPTPNEQ